VTGPIVEGYLEGGMFPFELVVDLPRKARRNLFATAAYTQAMREVIESLVADAVRKYYEGKYDA